MSRRLPEDDDRLDRSSSKTLLKGHERLYDAYNELHQLAQSFDKPFDAPAILVVGHQSDGKSALVEALMGFQFNSVGGGTKTRRPIAMHMKYNGSCVTPACFLLSEDGSSEQEVTIAELQAYIDADNAALEREQRFDSKEIVVRMEYKHCPNLTIIDTPGLISPAPGKKNCALQACAAQVEDIVRAKAQVPEYVILCLEDCSDWSNATTRRLVMQVDPTLSRTVLVSTKLDTRIPQFARPSDCEMFIRPTMVLEGCSMLGDGPFFTSVPSGRVGMGPDFVFPSQDAFRDRLAEREAADIAELESKLGRKLNRSERDHIGVGALRRYLEHLLQRRYLDAVPAIVPLLEREQRAAQQQIEATRKDLASLNPDQLKDKGRVFVDAFLNRLQQLLRGTVAAAADKWGETLSDEHARVGAFVGSQARTLPVPDTLPNSTMRLYGGAQFHRAMSEFRLVVGALPCPDISREEIVNACGLDYEGGHDGVNYVRTACVIAVSKAKQLLEPYIHQLGYRLAHVLRRLLHISLALMQQEDGSGASCVTTRGGMAGGGSGSSGAHVLALTEQFVRRVSSSFHGFLEEVETSCKERCLEDLASTTRYVSWSLHTRNNRNIRQLLGKVRVTAAESPSTVQALVTANSHPISNGSKPGSGSSGVGGPLSREASMTGGTSTLSLPDMLEATLWNRQLTGISEDIVTALVCQMYEGIRDHLVQAAELKFNCFFLMPLVDVFPARLRKELEQAYEEGLDRVFDAMSVRSALEARQASLEEELRRVERLQRKFQSIHQTLVHGPSMASGPLSRAIDLDASLMLASTANLSGMAGAVGGPVQTVSPVGTAASAPGTRLVTPVAVTGAKAGAADGSAKATVRTGSPPRRVLPSATGAAAIAAQARAHGPLQQAERDRAERDTKDKSLVNLMGAAGGGVEKAAAFLAGQQQHAQAPAASSMVGK